MLNFSHTYLLFKDLIRTYFCKIYVILWDLIEIKKTKFLSLKLFDLAFCRSTEVEIGRPVRSTDVHRRVRSHGLVGRSTRRSTVQRALLSGNGPGRPDRSTGRELLLSVPSLGRPGGRPEAQRAEKFDRWASRPGGRPEGQNFPFVLPTGRNFMGL